MLTIYFKIQSVWVNSESEADKIVGVWLNESKDRKFKCENNLYEAKPMCAKDASEGKNTGCVIFKDLQYMGNGAYADGKVFAPERDEWIKCKAELMGEQTMIFTGMKGMFSKSQTGSRQTKLYFRYNPFPAVFGRGMHIKFFIE